jgi:hypothetical protein
MASNRLNINAVISFPAQEEVPPEKWRSHYQKGPVISSCKKEKDIAFAGSIV